MAKDRINRISELDLIRGVALLLMVYFHAVYDMSNLYGYAISTEYGINYWVGKAAGYLFILVAAISCRFSRGNRQRGLRILGWALVLTVATHLYAPQEGIKFGILHFLGVSILLYHYWEKLRSPVLFAAGTLLLVTGYLIRNLAVPFDWLFFLGLHSIQFSSADYYPFAPYLGVFFWGILLGRWLYSSRKSLFAFPIPPNPISWMGRHTLLIYLVHQPVILGILELISRWKG